MQPKEITASQIFAGVEPGQIVKVGAAIPKDAGCWHLVYRSEDGSVKEKMHEKANPVPTNGLASIGDHQNPPTLQLLAYSPLPATPAPVASPSDGRAGRRKPRNGP